MRRPSARHAPRRKERPKKPKRNVYGLSLRQENFVNAYLANGGNATQAAITAGYSERSAHTQAHVLLKNPEVRARLRGAELAAANKAGATKERVLREQIRLAFSDMRQVGSWKGSVINVRNSEDLDDETAAAIQEIRSGPHGVTVKLYDKRAALDSLAKTVFGEGEAQREFEQAVLETIEELEPDAARKVIERLALRRSLQQPPGEA